MNSQQELVLTGNDLTIENLVDASLNGSKVSLHPSSRQKMKENRSFAEKVAARGDDVYGLTTGVGMRKKRKISETSMVDFNTRMIDEHATGQGPPIPSNITRAAAIILLNTLAKGYSNVRLDVADIIAKRLSDGPPLKDVPLYGITGMGDVTPLAHLTKDLLNGFPPAAGEALPLIAQSSFVTAYAAFAIHGTRSLLEQCVVLSALDIEALASNPSPFWSGVAAVRPYPGYEAVIGKISGLLHGSRLHSETPQSLQPPLSFRCAASVLGAAFDALFFCENQVSIELNAHQQNPLASQSRDCMLPVAHFDMQAVSSALDFMRIALAPCLTSQAERSVKLLQKSITQLTDGLEPRGDKMGHGLSEIVWPLQGITAEAKLLAQPVSFEVGSSYQAEGLEDRMTMAGLAARRLDEMLSLSRRMLSISVIIATQAIHLRGVDRLGDNLRQKYDKVRQLVPVLLPGQPPPSCFEELVASMKNGTILR